MTDHKVLLIESPARLSIDHGRLRIVGEQGSEAFFAPVDIAVLCLHEHKISLTSSVLRLLAASGAVLLVTDERHYPCALTLPYSGNMWVPQRLHDQIRMMDTPLSKNLWSQIVRSRLRTEATNLRYFGLNGALRLERLVKEVQPGDITNAESQGAKHYWKCLFGTDFVRVKEGAQDGINARLNYGFAVLRALVARQLAISGLHSALGLGHRRKDNPFNLADDFTEPFRYLVERHIRNMGESTETLTPPIKLELLRFIEQEVNMNGRAYRLPSAVEETVTSYCRTLEKMDGELTLP
ncbi:MAG: type II CRISPR-associated endonuclease Cas1 [Candidatus Micrarchaeaceae archaeon]